MFSFKDVFSVFLFWENLVVLFSHQMSERVVGSGDKMRAADVLINLWLLGGSQFWAQSRNVRAAVITVSQVR